MKLAEIAERISAHLDRLEADAEWNRVEWTGRRGETETYSKLYSASARRAGSRVRIVYVSYQGAHTLTKAEALAYLGWLDAGNRGKHFEQQRSATPREQGGA